MNRRLTSFMLSALIATVAVAQERMVAPPQVPCPHPVVIDILGEKSPPTQDPADLPANIIKLTGGSMWNQTAINKPFADSFHFRPQGECCVWTKGTLTMEVKALQGGSAGSSTSANDGVTIYSNGTAIQQVSPWSGGVTTGAVKTLTFNIPASVLALGRVSFYVEDDTAVVWAHLHLEGCCIR